MFFHQRRRLSSQRPRAAARGMILLLALLAAPAEAGMVRTAAGRLEGKVVLQGDHVSVDGKKVAWSDILYVLPDEPGKALPRRQRVRFKNGESWPVELVRLADKKLVVRSDLFGEKAIDVELLAVIEFAAQAGSPASRQTRTLYRTKEAPIPGMLLSLSADKLSMESPLGAINLPRDGLAAYVFADPAPGTEKDLDEVTLIDGSVLRGRLVPEPDRLKLEHPLVGSVTLPAKTVRSIVRHVPTVHDLTELLPQSVQTLPLVAVQGTQAARFQPIRGDEQGRFVKGLAIEPKTVVRYRLPQTTGKNVRLRMTIVPIDGAAGPSRVKISAGKSVSWEREVPVPAKPEEISLELPAGEDLTIEVDFGARLRFPCGVILGDPHLVLE